MPRPGSNGRTGNAGRPAGYRPEEEFIHDLQLIRDSLISHGDGDAANAELLDLIRLTRTFGFYLARLDIRQESTVHTEAVAELLSQLGIEQNYAGIGRTAASAAAWGTDRESAGPRRPIRAQPR